jgi:hypothetical protein
MREVPLAMRKLLGLEQPEYTQSLDHPIRPQEE